MAAHIIYKDGREKIWHVGQKPFDNKSDVWDVTEVQIDGSGAELIYGFGINRIACERVHNFQGEAAIMYCIMIFHLYGHCEKPTITEQGITTLMQGMCEPDKN